MTFSYMFISKMSFINCASVDTNTIILRKMVVLDSSDEPAPAGRVLVVGQRGDISNQNILDTLNAATAPIFGNLVDVIYDLSSQILSGPVQQGTLDAAVSELSGRIIDASSAYVIPLNDLSLSIAGFRTDISSSVAALKITTADISSSLSTLEVTTADISSNLSTLMATTTDISSSLSTLEVTTADISSSIAALKITNADISSNLSTLEVTTADISSSVATLKITTTDISSSLSTLEVTTADISSSIAVLKITTTDISSSLSTLEVTTADISSSLSTLGVTTTDISSSIAALKITTADISSNLSTLRATTADLSTNVNTQLISVKNDISNINITLLSNNFSNDVTFAKSATTKGQLIIDMSGTRSAPAITFTNPAEDSSATGIYHPADGTLAIATNGTNALSITPTDIYATKNFNADSYTTLNANGTFTDPSIRIKPNMAGYNFGIHMPQVSGDPTGTADGTLEFINGSGGLAKKVMTISAKEPIGPANPTIMLNGNYRNGIYSSSLNSISVTSGTKETITCTDGSTNAIGTFTITSRVNLGSKRLQVNDTGLYVSPRLYYYRYTITTEQYIYDGLYSTYKGWPNGGVVKDLSGILGTDNSQLSLYKSTSILHAISDNTGATDISYANAAWTCPVSGLWNITLNIPSKNGIESGDLLAIGIISRTTYLTRNLSSATIYIAQGETLLITGNIGVSPGATTIPGASNISMISMMLLMQMKYQSALPSNAPFGMSEFGTSYTNPELPPVP